MTAIGVVLFSGALFPWLQRITADPLADSDGDPLKQAVAFTLYLYAAGRLVGSWRSLRPAMTALLPALLFVGLALASTSWSEAPESTFRRAIALLGTMVFGLFVASRAGAVKAIKVVAVALGVVAVLSAVVALAIPSWGRELSGQHEGLWFGIFHHKNSLGCMMAIGVLTAIAVYQRYPHRRGLGAAMGVLCALLVLASGSSTALVLLISVPALTVAIRIFRLSTATRWALLILTLSLATVGIGVVVTNPQMVVQALGKDLTLTGRTAIWVLAFSEGLSTPWFGKGFDIFWRDGSGPGDTISQVLGFRIRHAHNSFIDLWLDLGLVGLTVALVAIGVLLRDAWRTYRRNGSPQAQWAMIFISVMLIMSLTESVIAVQHHIFWFLQVAFTVWTRREWLAVAPAIPPAKVASSTGH